MLNLNRSFDFCHKEILFEQHKVIFLVHLSFYGNRNKPDLHPGLFLFLSIMYVNNKTKNIYFDLFSFKSRANYECVWLSNFAFVCTVTEADFYCC